MPRFDIDLHTLPTRCVVGEPLPKLEMEREDDRGVALRRDSGESDAQDHKHEIHLTRVSAARIDDGRRLGKLYFAK
jgi:hypothetical protein